MTEKTKLEIIGEYRKDHPGPFCTRDGQIARILTKTDGHPCWPIVGFIRENKDPTIWREDGRYYSDSRMDNWDLMCARKVPVQREFWIVGGLVFLDGKEAKRIHDKVMRRSEVIHAREVLPGEGA